MSIALAHFAAGAILALLLVAPFPGSEETDQAFYMYLGGIFGMLPDLSKFIPQLEPIHNDTVLSSIFALHGVLDMLDPNDSILVGAVMIGLLGAVILVTRNYRRGEK